MEYKRILVLANSMKKGGRCVAGRQVATSDGLASEQWLRPVSDADEGELFPKHMTLESGGHLGPMDIVDVPVSCYAGDETHPEDWRVTGGPWRFVERCTPDTIASVIEQPASLWLQAGRASDRVTTDFLKATKDHQSLYLIRPEHLRLRYWQEYNPFKGYVQKKTRAVFNYRGITYDMGFTDPKATAEYCKSYPSKEKPAQELVPPCQDNCALCVSLTPALNGTHYKVVATLLPLR